MYPRQELQYPRCSGALSEEDAVKCEVYVPDERESLASKKNFQTIKVP